jgi:hypothetical protein
VPWAVIAVQVLSDYRLAVRFRDGTAGEVDASRLIFGPGAGVFAALRDPDVFARAHVSRGAVTWPNDLDLAPDAMYDSIQATGVFVPD